MLGSIFISIIYCSINASFAVTTFISIGFQHRQFILCDARFRHALTAEMSETFPSGGSMHASVKLEGIDGRAPQERVEHVA